jgi:hypothetical protein
MGRTACGLGCNCNQGFKVKVNLYADIIHRTLLLSYLDTLPRISLNFRHTHPRARPSGNRATVFVFLSTALDVVGRSETRDSVTLQVAKLLHQHRVGHMAEIRYRIESPSHLQRKLST